MRRVMVVIALVLGPMAVVAGCNAIFGIGDYKVTDDAALPDGAGADGPVSCESYDPASGKCYPAPPCAATNDPELLNACTGAQCVPFDDTARIPNLPKDGKLPPVTDPPPPVDAGAG
ncbi:MAG TPA: hypothetical protein VIF62_10765 [Labilithrix sp.]